MPQNEELLQLPLNNAGSAYEPTRPLTQQDLRDYQWKTASINLRSGMSGYLAGSKGYFLGFAKGVAGVANGTPVFAVGDPAGNYVAWDGTTLSVVGNVTITGGLITSAIKIQGSGEIQNSSGQTTLNSSGLDLSLSTPGSSGAGIINADSSNLGDSAGWHNTGVWGQVGSTPTTIGGYNITDAQSTLENASDTGQVLYRDNGGTPYFADKYGSEINFGTLLLSLATFNSSSLVQWGSTVGIANPGQQVSIYAIATGSARYNAAATRAALVIEISVDGGVTWTSFQAADGSIIGTGDYVSLATQGYLVNQTPTGDVQARVKVLTTAAANTDFLNGYITLFIYPKSIYYLATGVLAASVPASVSGNCSAYYPVTTCTTVNGVMVTPTGGTPPYTYAWAKVSGTGTLSNTTSQTVTITDTETTADAGATHNTVVNCTVTDSAGTPASVTTSNCTVTNTFTRLYNPVSVTVSTTNQSCVAPCGITCTSTGTATANASGGDGTYTYAWTITSGPGSIISGATSQTCNLSYNNNATHPASTFSTIVKCVVTDGHSSSGNGSGTVTFRFQCYP